ncbi:FecR family protein [Chryseolinea serpens]|uniref:FecR family protein n=1 Tax=Chryseolinea serpens TaxID=947013 RepID=A0A1M5JN70_9BACT|nr:FecR domain-containing protein [Chryseolinea serpens]SHG41845.1 FecR family protein [Chryseolinea serpens]
MDKEKLDDLIAKYYRGETSLEEEEILLAHYNRVPSDLSADRAPFLYFDAKRKEEPSAAFADRIEDLMGNMLATKITRLGLMLRIAAVLIVGLGLSWYFLSTKGASGIQILTTKAGEQTRIVLPDSTVVWLNETTELQYPDPFQEQQRDIWLKGEAYFEVHSNTAQPFIVHTGEVSTTVVGTAFNLRSYENEQTLALDVTHGSVRFGAEKNVVVVQGQGARFDLKHREIETTPSNPNARAWKTRQLAFDGTAMRDILLDLERYFHVPFEVEDPALLRCTFTGTFQNATLEEVLGAIGYSLHVHYTLQGGKYILSGQNCEGK